MFGLEILDVILGLAFVYLLLSLICSAVNEYIAGLTNRRGTALVAGISKLLDDIGDPGLKREVLGHRLIRSMYSRDWRGRPRAPSYIPARTFAMALLDTVENRKPSRLADAAHAAAPAQPGAPATPVFGEGESDADHPALRSKQSVRDILDLMKDDALEDVAQSIASEVDDTADRLPLPANARRTVHEAVATSRTELQKLHDSVEVWFNNSMDRVTGGYKRRTQLILWLIGLVVAILLNADTFDMWRRLSTDDKLRESVALQASNQLPRLGGYLPARIPSDSSRAALTDAGGAPGEARPSLPLVRDTSPARTTPADSIQARGESRTDTATAGATPPSGGGAADRDTTIAGDSIASDSLRELTHAKAVFDSANAILARTQLGFGWGWDDAEELGMARRLLPMEARARRDRTIQEVAGERLAELQASLVKAVKPKPSRPLSTADTQQVRNEVRRATPLPVFGRAPFGAWRWSKILAKLVGLLLTAFALSLGAPFWFDTLNKIINIRSAGRAPDEKPKNPEAPGKRMAEQAKR